MLNASMKMKRKAQYNIEVEEFFNLKYENESTKYDLQKKDDFEIFLSTSRRNKIALPKEKRKKKAKLPSSISRILHGKDGKDSKCTALTTSTLKDRNDTSSFKLCKDMLKPLSLKTVGKKQFDKNLWHGEDLADKNDWVEKSVILHNFKGVPRPPKEIHLKRSQLRAISIPHPGTSYNPTFNDHQNLIKMAVDNELKFSKSESKIKTLLLDKFCKLTNEKILDMRKKETEEGLPIAANKNKTDSTKSKNEKPTTPEEIKNTLAQRHPRKKEMNRLHKSEINRKEKILQKNFEIDRLALFKKELDSVISKVIKKQTSRRQRAKQSKKEPKRIGRLKFKRPEIFFNDVGDISGGLVNLKPETNLLLERFKSFQERNLLSTGALRKAHRLTKTKKYPKRCY